ncbi:hypothetical protein GOV05_03705 [Candidatus Woesearchaeota archaeon]|nr:hypothetical protein [Candidatus Woesearchaeota archaeon]
MKLFKNKKKKSFFGFDKKKFLQVLLIDFGSLVILVLFLLLMLSIFSAFIPTQGISPDDFNLKSTDELLDYKNSLRIYGFAFFTSIITMLLGSVFLYNASRKLLWEKIVNDKYSFKGFWKYFAYNTTLTMTLSLIAGLIYLLINLFFGLITYLTSSIPFLVMEFLQKIIPITILFYAVMAYSYLLNAYYFENKTKIKKAIKKTKEYNIKKLIMPSLLVLLINYVLTYANYYVTGSNELVFSISSLLIFSVQISLYKIVVYENTK